MSIKCVSWNYFHQESNDKKMKAKDDQDGQLPMQDFCFYGGSEKSRFEHC